MQFWITNSDWITNLAYLVASVLFIIGLKGLGHPRSAVRGNFIGALGMLLAIVVTLLDRSIIDYKFIALGLAAGTAIGAVISIRIAMTEMPQMVALFNGFGGGASIGVAGAALIEANLSGANDNMQLLIATAASGLIGGVTLFGSLIAWAKLQEVKWAPGGFAGVRIFNSVMGLMSAQGARGNQLVVVSYGEERPVCRVSDEACWAENRRVEIVYTAR